VCKTSKAHTHTLEHSARNSHAQKYAINLAAFYDCSSICSLKGLQGLKVCENRGLKHQPQVHIPLKKMEKARLRAAHRKTLILLHCHGCFWGLGLGLIANWRWKRQTKVTQCAALLAQLSAVVLSSRSWPKQCFPFSEVKKWVSSISINVSFPEVSP